MTSPFSFLGPTLTDSGSFPPDTMGAVGPSQFIASVNGRFRSYDKATGLADGALDADPDVFFAPVETPGMGTFTSDPHIRFDRLAQRWIIVMVDVPGVPTMANRVVLAVSNSADITLATVWRMFFFDQAAGGTDNLFADYPTLGVDASALYIGMNMFRLDTGAFAKTNMYVVRKSSVLGAGPVIVTRFNGAIGAGAGPFTPQGVDNFDPAATTGFFVGVDNAGFGQLDVRKVTNPGGTPVLSADQPVAVPDTFFPIPVDHLGNLNGAAGQLDALDDRLYAAQLRNGHIWTAHTIGVDATGAASATPTRDATRWYEVSVSGTPALVQSGTVFDPAATNPKSYWIPSVAVSGQNIMAIGGSVAGLTHTAEAWYSARLPGDAAGLLDPPTEYTAAGASYNPPADPPAAGLGPRRWGDFSMTSVDPDDDMTIWTIQEYASSTDVWGTRVARLRPPPPATPATTSPIVLPTGLASTPVTLTGTSAAGSGFFDPGPGFVKRLQADTGCGATVNSLQYLNPTTVQLNLNTTAATSGRHCPLTITNPDGQAATGTPNVPPGANADAYSVAQGTVLSAPSVLANDTDGEGDVLSAIVVANPAHGALTLEPNGTFSYTPDAAYSGPDSFTYRANDGFASSAEAPANITVNASPPPPPVVVTPRPPPPPAPLRPVASFTDSPKSLRVTRTGRFRFRFRVTALSRGTIGFVSAKPYSVGARRRRLNLGTKRFTTSAGAIVTPMIKLSSANLRVLKRRRTIRFNVIVTLSARRFPTALTLKAPSRTTAR